MAEGSRTDFAATVFDVKDEPMPKGSWWWWFWLFFFDNPDDPARPRQLMILWSTKNEKSINCNGLDLKIRDISDRMNMEGAVACWYFDGKKMHHNFVLEHCRLKIKDGTLSTDTKVPTSFSARGNDSTVRIGKDMEFKATHVHPSDFARPEYHKNKIIGKFGYNILRMNHFDLGGTVGGRKISGAGYFQRVFVNAPSVPWYWGGFHFERGGMLTYFNPRALGISIKKDIAFFDGKGIHRFKDIHVKRKDTDKEGKCPEFMVSGQDEKERIEFSVSCYEHSSWTFRKRTRGIIPNKLVYNEYPAKITQIRLTDKATGKVLTEKDFGTAVGNAEHTTGFLI
jgi:hypothetical protein